MYINTNIRIQSIDGFGPKAWFMDDHAVSIHHRRRSSKNHQSDAARQAGSSPETTRQTNENV